MRKCKVCRGQFEARSRMQIVCSGECGLAYARKLRTVAEAKTARADRVETKKKIDAIRPLSYWVAQAQAAFNAWVRARDAKRPCISCGQWKNSWDAGHYLTRGARPELRFDEANCHKQCVQCNQHLHGNTAAMRISLMNRIGWEEVERLEGPNPPLKLTAEKARAIRDHYRAKLKELQRASS
jgi:Bacteriophage Lambda NinG protein